MAIIGAGPIGIEMGQAFQRLGTQVTIFDIRPRILPNDDEELAEILQGYLEDEGINFQLASDIESVSETPGGN